MNNPPITTIAAISVLLTFAYTGFLVWLSYRRALARSPRGIVHRIQVAGSHEVKLGNIGGVWNPAKPLGAGNLVLGPGVASYTLGSDGTVHLRFETKGGDVQDFSGPIPQRLSGEGSEADVRGRTLRRRITVAYAITLLGAFVVGVAASSGGWATRTLVGAGALVGAMVLCAIVVRVLRVDWALRSASADRGNHPGR